MSALILALVVVVLAVLGLAALVCYCILSIGRINQADAEAKARYDRTKGY